MRSDKYTKAALPVFAICLAMSVGVDRPARSQTTRPLDAEARTLALRVWEKGLVKCGDSYYTYRRGDYLDDRGRLMRVDEHGPREVHPNDYLGLAEYKGISFSTVAVKPEPLSYADRLNGVQWKGDVMLPSFSVYRYRDRSYGKWQPWQDWQSPEKDFRGLSLQKKNGQWFSDGNTDGLVPIEHWLSGRNLPSCTSFADPRN
jgi:hypothetical protein